MRMEGYEDEAAPDLGQYAVIPPSTVKAAKRLADDLRVLTMLTNLEVPPLRRLRGSSKLKVLYGFGDSSGNGFGWSIDFGEEIRYEHGLWSETLCEEHSNYKELRNLVNALMRAGLEGRLTGREIFLCTDNQVAEGSYYRGTAASQSLFELVVELYIMQMKYDIIIHVIWIAGTRMIQQGTDDLSRGGGADLATQGLAMRGEVPLSLGELERNVFLEPWIRGWVGEEGLVTLTPEGWFSDAHLRGSFLWAPPPAAAAAAVEQLCDAVHKRPCCRHVFVCPLIIAYLWRKQLLKACAFSFTMKSVCDIWPYTEHEPLGFFIVPPSSGTNHGTYGVPSQWWTWRLPCVKCQKMTTFGRGILCANYFCSREGWNAYQKAWCAECYKPSPEDRYPIRLPSDEEGQVMMGEEDDDRFEVARPGDHLLCPFQCELCLFRNIQGRSLLFGEGKLSDVGLL
jgi:hypothetical protein